MHVPWRRRAPALTLLLLVLAGTPVTLHAEAAATAFADVRATIVEGVSISQTEHISFPILQAGTGGRLGGEAEYLLLGPEGQVLDVQISPAATLTAPGGDAVPMRLRKGVDPGRSPARAGARLIVEASLLAPPNAAGGSYEGSYSVLANYN